ncbi:MAG: hypothetical protein GYB25_14365 [Rhodobacteraceae bacterium]|nr:hypothetical protein [Paracoccaceae bacterium]
MLGVQSAQVTTGDAFDDGWRDVEAKEVGFEAKPLAWCMTFSALLSAFHQKKTFVIGLPLPVLVAMFVLLSCI